MITLNANNNLKAVTAVTDHFVTGNTDLSTVLTRTSGDLGNDRGGGEGKPPVEFATHDKAMAGQFLACLDPHTDRFTFQFFSDGPDRYAEVFHGTLDEVWPKVLALNTLNRRVGAFVTINETDFKGRREDNIRRPRALFVDADTPEQIANCINEIQARGVPPDVVVDSGRGMHFYWPSSDIPRDQFSAFQKLLIDRLGTDRAIHDLPRVMRLPGTLHLKDEAQPRLVKLRPLTSPPRNWAYSELVATFGTPPVSAASASGAALPDNVVPFKLPDWAIEERPAPVFAGLPTETLSEGLGPNIQEISSALAAIPPSAIATEQEWMKVARALAHEAAVYGLHADRLWHLLDEASRRAAGYDQQDNRERFQRYTREAFNRSDPITISTLYHLALQHGWNGRAASTAASSTTAATPISTAPTRAIPVSSLPLVPPKRQWLHGTDLIRNNVTVLAAPGGRAKSTWLLTCGLACAANRDLLGANVFGGPLRVLVLSTEDALPELALRLRAAMQHYGLTDADVPHLYVIGADRWGLPLLRADGNRAILDNDGMTALNAELDHIAPDVLIIDPLINLLGGVSANDNAAAALLMRHLVGLATSRGMAIALAHHTSKGRDLSTADAAMGAASFMNLARIALSIEPLDEKNAGAVGLPPWEAKSVFRVLGTKQNFSPPRTEDRWFRLVSVAMPNAEPPIYPTGDNVAVVEPFKPGVSGPAFPDALVQDALAAVDAASPPLTPSKRSTDRYAAPVIAAAIKVHRGGQVVEADGKSVLDHLVNAGLVAVTDVKVARGGKGNDTRKGLVLTAAGRVALRSTEQPQNGYPTPQHPRSPATMLQDDAGGDPIVPRDAVGGVGGNAGAMQTGAERLNRSVP